MYCLKCGADNPDDAQLCSSCGQVLTNVTSKSPTPIPKTSGLATAAFVLAVLSPFSCMMTALPAIILGIVALVKISRSIGQLKGKGLAIAGICLPAVLLPLVSLLFGILLPVLARTRQIAFRMICDTNLSNLGKSMLAYANDHEGRFPTPSKWCDLLIQETGVSPTSFQCKGAGEGRCNYAMNRNVEGLGTNAPPYMVLLFETYPGWNQVGGPEVLTTKNHGGDRCNVVFVDGHVEFVKPAALDRLRWTGRAESAVHGQQGSFRPRTPKKLPAKQEIDFPKDPPTCVVEIVGDVPEVDFSTWQCTGLSLLTGDVLYIQAEGQINYVNNLTLTPDGRGDIFPPSLLPNISFMSLIGKTHFVLLDDGIDSSGIGIYGPGFVGSEFKMTYVGPGRYGLTGDNVLYLAVNDSMDNDNSLSFTVSIWIVRDGKVVHNESRCSSAY